METLRNLGDLLGAALAIEEKGSEFYKKAAGIAKDALAQQLFLDLVQWENDHYAKFNKMLESLPPKERWAVDMGEGLDIESIMASGAIKLTREPAGLLKGDEEPEEILDLAVSLERDSIVFYMFLRGIVPVVDRKKEIDGIVLEEIGHVKQLEAMRERLTAG